VLRRFLQSGPKDLTPERAAAGASRRLADALGSAPNGLEAFLREGPLGHPQFAMLAGDLRALCTAASCDYADLREQAAFRMLVDRIRGYFLTQDGAPRKARGFGSSEFKKEHCGSEAGWKRHREAVEAVSPAIEQAVRAFRRGSTLRGGAFMLSLAPGTKHRVSRCSTPASSNARSIS
jgi:hypothetical protein